MIFRNRYIFVVGLLINILSIEGFATSLESSLLEFHKNPKEFMGRLPKKINSSGKEAKKVESYFSKNDILSREYVRQKDKYRREIIGTVFEQHSEALLSSSDMGHIKAFIEQESVIRDLAEMERQDLRESRVPIQPWTDDYWPLYAGGVASRYADSLFGPAMDWKNNFDYVTKNPATEIYNDGDLASIDELSPAEKYDFLIGDQSTVLTDYSWSSGQEYYKRYGKVESWMGICHGWAPAAYMIKRPNKKVQVLASDGKTSVTFYPSDIKALASQIWATVSAPVRFLGGRCNDKNPEKDEVGRIKSEKCFDTNPGLWHVALVNRLGVHKSSFVIDATYDYEVWNQPLLSYKYEYFNPQTLKTESDLGNAIIPIEEYDKDKFKKYRSDQATHIVGISMGLTYVVETRPRQRDTDSEANDATKTVYYLYDLELDKDGNIIGGEWYQNSHPDFMWTPTQDAKVLSVGDYQLLGEALWDGKSALPKNWSEAGWVSAKRGQPLAKIIDSLLLLSQTPDVNIGGRDDN